MKFELSRLAINCSNEEIIAEIQRVASLINKKYLSYKDFNQVAKVSAKTVCKRFGSWHKGLAAAGFELSSLGCNCLEEEIIAEIQRVDSLINKKYLSSDDFDQVAKVTSGTIRRRFGSWHNALAAAGLEAKSAMGPNVKKEQLISEVQKIARELGKEVVTQDDFRRHSNVTTDPGLARRRFGSWANLMKAADLSISKSQHRYSNDEYFENLLKVWTHYGRQPFYREIDQYPSTISAPAYTGRFGSWRKALEAFVARMNNDEAEPSEDLPPKEITESKTPKIASKIEKSEKKIIKPEDRREINLSLRYKVLSRDNFKCVRCGRSPATCLGIVLHVDHKNPFSKTGKTTLENLETKCSDCNIGKGNRHIE